jgi:flagellar biosynthesis/type III secretory pathway protein FliH
MIGYQIDPIEEMSNKIYWQKGYQEGFERGKIESMKLIKQLMADIKALEAFVSSTST